jgi:RimJ/RimL family protein N-acetyltransferase
LSNVQATKILKPSELGSFPDRFSFFDPIIPHEVKEAIEAGGEVYVSEDGAGKRDALFIYDEYEATGTIFTRSKMAFDYFYKLKPSSYIFSEFDVKDIPREPWNLWELDVASAPADRRFKHQVSIESDVKEIERFISSTQPETNPKWIGIALKNGDKCFVNKVANRIVGMSWMTIVGDFARSHGLFVEPLFRKQGMMRDNLQARLVYLKSRGVHRLVGEIAESNIASTNYAKSAGERIVGKMFLYTSPDAPEGTATPPV